MIGGPTITRATCSGILILHSMLEGASYSLLLAHELPPKGTGGETYFADVRMAYDVEGLVVDYSFCHSRKIANPDSTASEFERPSPPKLNFTCCDLYWTRNMSGERTENSSKASTHAYYNGSNFLLQASG